ncbi:centrosomal protein of 170 kDa protein B isoform X2 [Pungitius pungitius]|uniref:centrosomal protein of 170 kDa protein B isoform X2 n=1 Tax=Pungitius pungitius TaxID=134920 RepID=UPI002E0F0CAA
MSVTSWFLVSSSGTRHRLPREMIFVGRDDCELMLQSRSVDKQHAVINYEQHTDEHMVKDLGSLNGTFVNDLRIPDQTYITLKLSDVIRFGYDAHVYILERSQHKVPEEALKHEKYTSQWQLSIKALQAKVKEKQQLQSAEKSKNGPVAKLLQKAERKAQSLTAATDPPISKPTPLYGQPSWWGEDEDAAKKKKNLGGKSPEKESPEPAKDASRYEVNGSLSVNGGLSDNQVTSLYSYRREPSYFEIPTKESQQRPARKPESQVHEVPTKDTARPAEAPSPTPPAVQSHASFTIEFDECTPGKMKIKDHVTKFSFRQPPKPPPAEPVAAPTEVMSAESKVADWLVHSGASMTRKRTQGEDAYSTNSDPSVLNIPKKNQHEDGTHSDSEDPAINGRGFLQSEPRFGYQVTPQPLRASTPPPPPPRSASPVSEEPLSYSPLEPQSLPGLAKAEPHQAFVIEFFDEDLRKKRSQSFTGNASPPEPPGPRLQLEKAKKGSGPTGEGRLPPSAGSGAAPTQQYTVPLKGPAPTGFQRAGSLRREKTEERVSTGFSSRSSSSASARPFSSVGRRSKLAQEFTAEFLRRTKPSPPAGGEKTAPSSPPPSSAPHRPQTSSPIHRPVPLRAPLMPAPSPADEVQGPHAKNEEEDSLSDAGTYTIEGEVQDKELEEARSQIDQVPAPDAVLQEAPKWMSCWASLADSYAESGPSSGLFDVSSQAELSEGARGAITRQAALSRHHDVPTPSIHVHCDPNSTFDVGGRSAVAPPSPDSLHRLSVHDDVEPDSLSDASKSDDGSVVEQKRRPLSGREVKRNPDRLPAKSTAFYIGSAGAEPQPDFGGSDLSTAKTFSTSTLTKPGKVKPSASAPVLSPESKEGALAVLIRQESFTKARPSSAGLPQISSLQAQRGLDPDAFQGAANQDTHSYLKETEDVLAALEAKLQAGRSGTTPPPMMDSLSTESDVDSSSTVSQHSSRTRPPALPKNPSASGFRGERSPAGVAGQDPGRRSSASEKRRSPAEEGDSKARPVGRAAGPRRSVGRRGSADLSDDPPSLPCSDQESSSRQPRRRSAAPVQKEDAKTSRAAQALHRASSFSAPRPTRASTLRRARLGEASDGEAPETERSSSQQPQETRKLSRLDLLAMPRKRTNSFNTPSDTEASSSSAAAGISARRGSVSGPKPGERQQNAPPGKAAITRGRSSSAKYAGSSSSSRRRHKGSDYTSTSDEEYDSNQSTPKHKRSQPSSASHSPRTPARPQPVVALRPKPLSRHSEDENHEADAPHGWSNHSSEIARLSQDLAKDLAILAREIHDVAGDGDPQGPGVESRAPLSTVTAHEQLVPHIPEAGLKYQREPPGSSRKPEESDQEHTSRPRAQSGDQVLVDGLMLSSVSQITATIRENTEQLADKMKVLFRDRMDVWEETEAKVNSDDVPVSDSSSKEIASILKELVKVQRRLEVFNTVMAPSSQPDSSRASSGVRPSRPPPASRDWRTIHSVSKRGGGPRPSEAVRRAAVTPADQRAGYLV